MEAEGRLFCWLTLQSGEKWWLDACRDWSGSPDCNPPVQTLIPGVCVSLNYECEPTFTYKSRCVLRFLLPKSSETLVHKKKKKKELCQETFGQHQGPASSGTRKDKLLAVLNISSGSKMQCFPDSSFPDETAVQWTVSTCCELWKRMTLNPHNALVKSLFLTHHCHTINRDIHVQSTGVWCLCTY